MHYVIITGGTISGLGKGTTVSALGILFQSLGFRVTTIKIDPYLNVDAGTISPYEHGEVYVLDDGGEVDLDLGNYERALNIKLSRDHNLTTGKIYLNVIQRERRGDFLGKTVQVVNHVTDAIQEWIQKVAVKPVDYTNEIPDICLIEVGGTVGDIESMVYLEAIQQMFMKEGPQRCCLCHVAFVPIIGSSSNPEQKTKPTQHGVRELRQVGLIPSFIFGRCDQNLTYESRMKISNFCQVPLSHVMSLPTVENRYMLPEILYEQHFGDLLCAQLGLEKNELRGKEYFTTINDWKLIAKNSTTSPVVRIGIVGKYTETTDTYLSVVEALNHAGYSLRVKPEITWIDSNLVEKADQNIAKVELKKLNCIDGVLCPGGFGDRGAEGKILVIKLCREKKIPFLGICLGLQLAAIEFARNCLNINNATSEEFEPNSSSKIVVFMPEICPDVLGGTMRVGTRKTIINDIDSLAAKIYNHNLIVLERHRHRYEINVEYVDQFENKGFKFTGHDEYNSRMEIAELSDHPFFFCVQFHPEFTSRPLKPNPCYLGLLHAALKYQLTNK